MSLFRKNQLVIVCHCKSQLVIYFVRRWKTIISKSKITSTPSMFLMKNKLRHISDVSNAEVVTLDIDTHKAILVRQAETSRSYLAGLEGVLPSKRELFCRNFSRGFTTPPGMCSCSFPPLSTALTRNSPPAIASDVHMAFITKPPQPSLEHWMRYMRSGTFAT